MVRNASQGEGLSHLNTKPQCSPVRESHAFLLYYTVRRFFHATMACFSGIDTSSVFVLRDNGNGLHA